MDLIVEVIESKPVVHDGAVRHRLILRPVTGDGGTQR
jgi:hypothetical protein